MLCDRLGVSERRACQIAGQHRSTQRHEPERAPDDQALRARLREISAEKPRWGYRRAHARLIEEGWSLNRKRTQRLWRAEALRVPARKRKRRRLGDNSDGKRLRAGRPDQVWALDFQSDETADGRALRLLNVVDEFTREALAMECEHSITADQTVTTLERLVAERGVAPERVRMDNGPELTAHCFATGAVWAPPPSPTSSPARPGRTPTRAQRTSDVLANLAATDDDVSHRCIVAPVAPSFARRARRGSAVSVLSIGWRGDAVLEGGGTRAA